MYKATGKIDDLASVDKLYNRGTKLTNLQVDNIVNQSVHNSSATSLRLGRYEQGYIDDAIKAGDSYFSTPDDVWASISCLDDSEIWKINQRVIDDAISQGKTIKISQNPNKWSGYSTYFGREMDYLRSLGYKFDYDAVGGYWYAYK